MISFSSARSHAPSCDQYREQGYSQDPQGFSILDSRITSSCPTLALLADDLRRTTDANIALTVEDVGGSALTQLLLYQIAREALVNAARHAHAENIQVTLTAADGCARLIVVDDGVGFQPDSIKPGHFGLQLMRERAEIAGGSLVIESSARGVMVVAAIPLGRDL